MENFKEELRSFLDTELNNLINERCKETNTVWSSLPFSF